MIELSEAFRALYFTSDPEEHKKLAEELRFECADVMNTTAFIFEKLDTTNTHSYTTNNLHEILPAIRLYHPCNTGKQINIEDILKSLSHSIFEREYLQKPLDFKPKEYPQTGLWDHPQDNNTLKKQ